MRTRLVARRSLLVIGSWIICICIMASCAPKIWPRDWPIPELKMPPGSKLVAVYGGVLFAAVPGAESEWHLQIKYNKPLDEMLIYIESILKELGYRREWFSPDTHSYCWIAPDQQTEVSLLDWTWSYDSQCDYQICIRRWYKKLPYWDSSEPIP